MRQRGNEKEIKMFCRIKSNQRENVLNCIFFSSAVFIKVHFKLSMNLN